MWVIYQLFLLVVLKCLLHRHFVALEIWHLNSDEIVLQTRIEHFDSSLSSRETNTESKDHMMQMDKFSFMPPLCFRELRREHTTVCWCKEVLWALWLKHHTHSFLDVFCAGRIKVGSQLRCFAETCVWLCGRAGWAPLHNLCEPSQQSSRPSQARYSNIFKRNNVKWSKVAICSPQRLRNFKCTKHQNLLL